ncbi:DEAD/DEAH box helicase [Paracoccus shanxieyensis]|uniref:DEAD-box ATP-dependent RNA helicase RhpA n=1 Tax=Paracoccus shanxieyensis TaxID=2675752 RepID=A0A6L6IZ77_9RHOB|nr:DEAD/DEAH box helicase [Paracoccus shanxieyensis]MTH86594.1 DEAD/DEAH box helicase [Paracoccus shanxieyensis]
MTKFSDLKLDPKVLQAIAEAGYESPTPIQAAAIPPALEGRDVLGIAQTGTGKTASFTLPMITLLGRGRARARMPRSLVLCPTRELAAQVAENFDVYAKHTRLTKALLIGGVSFGEQDKLIDRGVDVLIATPGRLLDHFERGKLLLNGVQIMVVDEADRMLDMGFIPDIERIFQLTPFTRQTLFFSATMAPEIERITDTFLHAPERVEVARQATTSETITQKLVEIAPTRRDQSAKQKRELLRALIRAEGEAMKNAIIFCNRKTDVDIVAKSLKSHGFNAAPIHGDLDQRHRMATLDEFREGKLQILVASDVAARGLDIPSVGYVFNYDLPSHAEDYVHRIGRTGRAGRLGTAISISTPADEKYLTAIEALVKQTLPRADVPEGFSLSAAAQDAPRAPRENGRRGGRDRDRDRDRRGRRDDSEQRAASPEAPREDARRAEPRAAEARPETRAAESRAPEARVPESRSHDNRGNDNRGNDTRGHDHRSRRDDNRRDDNRRDDRHDRRDDRRSDRNSVMGMGDHVPEFMTRIFRPGLVEGALSDDAPDLPATEATAAPAAPVAAKPVAAEIPAKAPVQTIETPAQPQEASPAIEVAEAAPEASEAPAKPARKPRAPRKPRGKAAEPVQTLTEAEAATPEAPAATEAEAEATPAKPKRRTRTAKPKAEPALDAAETVETPAKKPAKPRAPRKKKADTAEQTAPAVAQPHTDETPSEA